MDPISSTLLGKVLGFGFDNYLQPMLKQATNSIDRLAEMFAEETERRRLSILRQAILHLQLRNESGSHAQKAQDLLIEAIALDPYAAVPLLLLGLLLHENESTVELAKTHIEAALDLNPLALVHFANPLPLGGVLQAPRLAAQDGLAAARASAWRFDAASIQLPSEHDGPSVPRLAKRGWRHFSAWFGMTTHNSQAFTEAAVIDGQAVYASWYISENLRKEGDHVLAKLREGKPDWLIVDSLEVPLLVGTKILLSSCPKNDRVTARNPVDGKQLFQCSAPYAEAMIAPRLDAESERRMRSEDASGILKSMSGETDSDGNFQAEPGFRHYVSRPFLEERFELQTPEGAHVSITNRYEHWHQPTMGTQLGTCMLAGTSTISWHSELTQ